MNQVKLPTEQFVLKKPVFYFYAPQGFGTSKLAGRIEQRRAEALDIVRDGNFVSERILDERRIGPDDDLVVVVGMALVELPQPRHRVELRAGGEALANCRGSA